MEWFDGRTWPFSNGIGTNRHESVNLVTLQFLQVDDSESLSLQDGASDISLYSTLSDAR
jgi:hypothetical protein